MLGTNRGGGVVWVGVGWMVVRWVGVGMGLCVGCVGVGGGVVVQRVCSAGWWVVGEQFRFIFHESQVSIYHINT